MPMFNNSIREGYVFLIGVADKNISMGTVTEIYNWCRSVDGVFIDYTPFALEISLVDKADLVAFKLKYGQYIST